MSPSLLAHIVASCFVADRDFDHHQRFEPGHIGAVTAQSHLVVGDTATVAGAAERKLGSRHLPQGGCS